MRPTQESLSFPEVISCDEVIGDEPPGKIGHHVSTTVLSTLTLNEILKRQVHHLILARSEGRPREIMVKCPQMCARENLPERNEWVSQVYLDPSLGHTFLLPE